MAKTYDPSFYSERHDNSLYSAQRIAGIAMDLVQPKSVVDVGCGVGTWLKAFQDFGVQDFLGLEGSWVDESSLVINPQNLIKTDLSAKFTYDRKFNLAISLEVAEHIDEKFADQFVDNIVNLAPVVLFSAAIPYQAGKHHVNEQWPDYWKEKFGSRGYVIVDCIRPKVWTDPGMEMWYAQNTFIYVEKESLQDYPKLAECYVENPMMLSAVLPRFYEHKLKTWPIMKSIRMRIKRALG